MNQLYRVEKNGITFYVQPEKVTAYQADGWDVYRQNGEIVTDSVSIALDDSAGGGIVNKEVTTHG